MTRTPTKAADLAETNTGDGRDFGPWLTTAQACEYLCFDGPGRLRSLYRFLDAKGVPRYRRGGRRILVKRADLDAALEGRDAVRRRNVIARQKAQAA